MSSSTPTPSPSPSSPSQSAPPSPPWFAPQRQALPHLRPGEEIYCWIGGYVPNGSDFDSLLIGIWERRGLRFVGCLKKDWHPEDKAALFATLQELPLELCPFYNLPEGEPALPPDAFDQCRWLFPSQRLAVRYEDLEQGQGETGLHHAHSCVVMVA